MDGSEESDDEGQEASEKTQPPSEDKEKSDDEVIMGVVYVCVSFVSALAKCVRSLSPHPAWHSYSRSWYAITSCSCLSPHCEDVRLEETSDLYKREDARVRRCVSVRV